jgi:hypothetical protein
VGPFGPAIYQERSGHRLAPAIHRREPAEFRRVTPSIVRSFSMPGNMGGNWCLKGNTPTPPARDGGRADARPDDLADGSATTARPGMSMMPTLRPTIGAGAPSTTPKAKLPGATLRTATSCMPTATPKNAHYQAGTARGSLPATNAPTPACTSSPAMTGARPTVRCGAPGTGSPAAARLSAMNEVSCGTVPVDIPGDQIQ